MKKDIFENNAHPFTVPDGYFDTLQKRVMSRIQAEESRTMVQARSIRMNPYQTLVAAAACILLIFAGAGLYMAHSHKQPLIAETVLDEDFFRWFYALDETTLLAESLDFALADDFMSREIALSEEDEAIIRFLERDNINVAAIVHSMNRESPDTYFNTSSSIPIQ